MKIRVEDLKCIGTEGQVVIVTTKSLNSINAKLQSFEKINGKWETIISCFAVIGKNGFTQNKIEGDGKSPVGKYSFGICFGKNLNPEIKFEYHQANINDFWVDDSTSESYNSWQTGPANGRWNSAENLLRSNDSMYDYAAVINYNDKRIQGKGSAIFFHVWRELNVGTSGCTATSLNNVINILKWLDPAKHPVIIQGPENIVNNM